MKRRYIELVYQTGQVLTGLGFMLKLLIQIGKEPSYLGFKLDRNIDLSG